MEVFFKMVLMSIRKSTFFISIVLIPLYQSCLPILVFDRQRYFVVKKDRPIESISTIGGYHGIAFSFNIKFEKKAKNNFIDKMNVYLMNRKDGFLEAIPLGQVNKELIKPLDSVYNIYHFYYALPEMFSSDLITLFTEEKYDQINEDGLYLNLEIYFKHTNTSINSSEKPIHYSFPVKKKKTLHFYIPHFGMLAAHSSISPTFSIKY